MLRESSRPFVAGLLVAGLLPLLAPFRCLTVPENADHTTGKRYRLVAGLTEGWTLQTATRGRQTGNSTSMVTSTICTCAKCGSTSLYTTLYKMVFEKEFDFIGPPYVQRMDSERWEHLGKRMTNMKNVPLNRSFALIRDPKERLMSAFRSKIQCGIGADKLDRRRLVPHLINLAGVSMDDYAIAPGTEDVCLNETSYLQTLVRIHRNDYEGLLDIHFRPQTLVCFLHAPPSEWSVVSTIGNPDAKCKLEALLKGTSDSNEDCSFGKMHGTAKGSSFEGITTDEEVILDEITSEEYEVLGPYL